MERRAVSVVASLVGALCALPCTTARSPVYEPPAEVSTCLNGASLYVAGPSEVMQLIGWLSGGEQQTKRASMRSPDAEDWNAHGGARSLACATRRNLAMRFWECKQHDYAARGRCREDLYANRPFEANCTGRTLAWRNSSFSLHGYWKSFQYSRADLAIHSAMRRELQLTTSASPQRLITTAIPAKCMTAFKGDTKVEACSAFCSSSLARTHCQRCSCKACRFCVRLKGIPTTARPSSSMPARAASSSPSSSSRRGLMIVQLSAGLQQFSRIPGHEEKRLHLVEDNATWPQEFFDEWVQETAALFRLFSPKQWRTMQEQTPPAGRRRVCVVWRAQNIAARHTKLSDPSHHPSTVNGINHWMNRVGIALARLHGLAVVDYTNITTSTVPLSTYADDRPTGASTRKADALEGDVYHGYKMNTLAPLWLSTLAKACCG